MSEGDRRFDYGPQRLAWSIQVPTEEVLQATIARREHHEERLAAWRMKELMAEKDLRERGIDFREAARVHHYRPAGSSGATDPLDQAASYTNYQQDPQLRQEYLTALKEAQSKVAEHLGRVRQYAQWEKMLSLKLAASKYAIKGDNVITLTFEDVQFFDMGGTFAIRVPEVELTSSKSTE